MNAGAPMQPTGPVTCRKGCCRYAANHNDIIMTAGSTTDWLEQSAGSTCQGVVAVTALLPRLFAGVGRWQGLPKLPAACL